MFSIQNNFSRKDGLDEFPNCAFKLIRFFVKKTYKPYTLSRKIEFLESKDSVDVTIKIRLEDNRIIHSHSYYISKIDKYIFTFSDCFMVQNFNFFYNYFSYNFK